MSTTSPARTVYVGLDAVDLDIAQEFARRDGFMPNLAHLLETSVVQETNGPLGYLVGGNWVTLYTGVSPVRHHFLCSGRVEGGTYEARWVGPVTKPTPVWEQVSRAGGRVAVLDAPHSALTPDLNGVQLMEWGSHDRHSQTLSSPPEFLAEINAKFGEHVLGCRAARPFPHHAPCDVSHREGPHRTTAENQTLLDEMLLGVERKAALSADLLAQGGWDLFFTVFGEGHCAGHQYWKHHDTTHPWHDAAETAALGGDPIRQVYAALDEGLGRVLEQAGDAAVYVNLSHRMRAHYDGTCLIEPVLWKLDQYVSGRGSLGTFSRAVDSITNLIPRSRRQGALTKVFEYRSKARGVRGPIGTDGCEVVIPQWVGARRWWAQPNDSVYGSVRLNLDGREPNGRIAAAQKRSTEQWLAERFHELINTETGTPAVAAVYFTDDHYERDVSRPDPMGDLIVEWDRTVPLDTVWSPATGVVTAPYNQWRTGDHDLGGLLLARGPGLVPGRLPGQISVMDIGPTLAASLGVDMPDSDGVARANLVPEHAGARNVAPALTGTRLSDAPGRISGPRADTRRAFDVPLDTWNEKYAIGLSQALHGEHVAVGDTRSEVEALRDRVGDLEQLAKIAETTAWLQHIEVPESLVVSVVLPTHNRIDVVERAIDSVRRQSYRQWELVVVDDGSTDGTWSRLEQLAKQDARIRPIRREVGGSSSAARNAALDAAKGDVVVYLDDDNRFDPDWIRSVAWAFTEYPETQVLYGARVIDDDVRHQDLPGRSLPIIQFLPWDRDAQLVANRVDQNVVAHRPTLARFDEKINNFTDWDMVLKLTDDCDPLPLPVIAAHYYSDRTDRLTVGFRGPAEDRHYDYVRRMTRERRGES